MWKSDGVSRHVVVQSVNAKQRTAKVLFLDTNTIELVSTIELDTVGPSVEESFSEGYGVHVGDVVFIHSEENDNGLTPPRVPSIGEPDSEMSIMADIMSDYPNWKEELHDTGRRCLIQSVSYAVSYPLGSQKVNWLGEVSKVRRRYIQSNIFSQSIWQLHLDGSVEVKLPDRTYVRLPIRRLSKLIDQFSSDQLGAMGLEMAEIGSDGEMDVDDEGGGYWPSVLQNTNRLAGAWEEDDFEEWGAEYVGAELQEDDPSTLPPVYAVPYEEVPSLPGSWLPSPSPPPTTILFPSPPPTDPHPQDRTDQLALEKKAEAEMAASEDHTPRPESDQSWERFLILPNAPLDHAFVSNQAAQPNKTFMLRLQKEFRVLRTSLPGNVVWNLQASGLTRVCRYYSGSCVRGSNRSPSMLNHRPGKHTLPRCTLRN